MQTQKTDTKPKPDEVASVAKMFAKLPESAKAYIEGFGAGVLQARATKKPRKKKAS